MELSSKSSQERPEETTAKRSTKNRTTIKEAAYHNSVDMSGIRCDSCNSLS